MMLGFSGMSKFGKMASTGLILAGVLILFLFVKWEMRQKSPVLDISLFINNKAFAFSNLAALINYSATYAITFFLSLYLQYIKALDPASAGAILIFQPIVMTLASPSAGRLSDRIEPGKVASIGMALIAVGLFLLAFIGSQTPMMFIIGVLVLMGLGFALFSSPNSNAVMTSVEKKYYGIASGTLGTMRLTGQMFSMGLAVLLFAIHIGHEQITPEYDPAFLISIRTGFVFFGILCSFGIIASLARGKIR
jgi:MFS family permease